MADPAWSNVVLLLHCEGTAGSSTLVDSSANANSGAAPGCSISTAHAKFGLASYLVPYGQNCPKFSFVVGNNLLTDSSNYTAEGWFLLESSTSTDLFSPGLPIYWNASTSKFAINGVYGSATTFASNTMHHLAFVRNAGVNTLYCDGVAVVSGDTQTPIATNLAIGGALFSTSVTNVYFDEVRWVKNEVLYTTNFTPPSSPFPETQTATGAKTTTFGSAKVLIAQTATGTASTLSFGASTNTLTQAATGSTSTAFGSPSNALNQPATGFNTTTLGSSLTNTLTQAATSLASTLAFGAPNAAYTQFPVAAGFSSTAFGSAVMLGINAAIGADPSTAFGTPKNIPNAVGIHSTVFGTGTVIFNTIGACSTIFGMPSYINAFRARGANTTAFGIPWTATNRSFQASGFSTTDTGEPISIIYNRVNLSPDATGVRSTTFGTVYALSTVTCIATGFCTTAFGGAAMDDTQYGVASGANDTAFGSPGLLMSFGASGARTTAFGAASAQRAQPVSGIAPTTAFGLPAATSPYMTTGSNTTRFGQPTALNQFRYPSSGDCTTQFGTASAIQTHRATPIYPEVAWGLPRARRNPSC